MVDSRRLFIAVGLSAEVKQALGQVAEMLAARVPARGVRWVKPELMHLTLRFLGDTSVSKLDAIVQVMETAVYNQSPLTLSVQGTGVFPNEKRPRVVWAGLAGQVAELAAFKRKLDAGLQPLGWEPEKRPFKPHLTLGRVRDAGQVRGVSWEVPLAEMIMEITAVCLIESQLTPQGPLYTTRHISQFVSG